MAVLKSLLAGVAAVVLAAIGIVVGIVFYLMLHHRPNTGADSGAIGWDPISVARLPSLLVITGIFLAGFIWEFRRATRE
jgi:uncharacterized BrkB/YihY/UPF0761 family membrane protein